MERKIKVLYLLNLAGWGGACQVVYDLAKNLDKSRFEIFIASSPHPDRRFLKDLKKEGIHFYTINHLKRWGSLFSDILAFKEILSLIRKTKPDIIHLHNSKAGFLGRWAGWFYKIFSLKRKPKIYFTIHGWSFQSELKKLSRLFIFLEKMSAKITDRLIAVSENVKKIGLEKKIAPVSKFLVIPNGVSIPEKEDKNLIKRQLGLEEDSFVFGYVARLAYPKRPDLFLEGALILIREEPKSRFIIIGDGPFYPKLKEFILKEKVEDKIKILGQKSPAETKKIMNAFDVNVLITESEGLGLVILETMALGRPNIASSVGGILEIIKDGVNGFLVKNEPLAISQKMKLLKQDQKLYKRLSQEAQKTIEEKFSLQKMIEKYEMLYGEINDSKF